MARKEYFNLEVIHSLNLAFNLEASSFTRNRSKSTNWVSYFAEDFLVCHDFIEND